MYITIYLKPQLQKFLHRNRYKPEALMQLVAARKVSLERMKRNSRRHLP